MKDSHHKCPVDGCEAKQPRHLLMCRAHWYRVPRDLREAINRTWKAINTRKGFSAERTFADIAEYRQAVDAAIKAVNAKVKP